MLAPAKAIENLHCGLNNLYITSTDLFNIALDTLNSFSFEESYEFLRLLRDDEKLNGIYNKMMIMNLSQDIEVYTSRDISWNLPNATKALRNWRAKQNLIDNCKFISYKRVSGHIIYDSHSGSSTRITLD